MPDYTVQTTKLSAPGNSLSAEMKTFYEKQLIDAAEPALVHDQFGTHYPIPRNGGKTIEFRKIDSLPKALTQLTEGVTPQGNKLNVSKVIAEVGQYGDFVPLSDMLDLTAIDPMMVETTKRLAAQASRTLDTITREVLAAGTNKVFAPKKDGTEVQLREDMTADCELTPRLIRMVAAKLKRQNTPKIGDSYVAIIHPDIACDLQGNEEWIEAHKYAKPENIYFGEIGKIAGVRFVETTEAKILGPGEIVDGVCRMTLRTALDSTGSATINVEEEITGDQANKLAKRIEGGEIVKIYIGGQEATLKSASAGEAGSASLTVTAAVKSVEKGAVVCGTGAGKDGSAIYMTLVLGADAYGVTSITGGGLEHIVKTLGSGGTSDPLNQRATCGWKATKTAERLVEQYMVRVEHASPTFSHEAVSN